MAVTTGSRIAASDLAGLASLANSKVGAGRLSNDVSPMYYSGADKTGYKILAGVKIDPANRGAGYRRGDYLQGFGGDLLIGAWVTAVDAGGGLLGLRVAQLYPVDLAATLPDAPQDFSSIFGGASTAGSGAKLYFTGAVVGPAADYAFPDLALDKGQITDLVILSAGRQYHAGDVLTVNGLAGATITVGSVAADGAITDFSVSAAGWFDPEVSIPAGITGLDCAGGHGTGALFAGLYVLPKIASWQSELSRLRGNLNGYFTGLANEAAYDALTLAISGPWPVGGLSASLKNQFFWFEDPGYPVSVTVGGTGSFAAQGKYKGQIFNTALWEYNIVSGQTELVKTPKGLQILEKEFAIVVGGIGDGTLTAFFYIQFDWIQGFTKEAGVEDAVYDALPDDGATVGVFNVTTTLPGAAITQKFRKFGNADTGIPPLLKLIIGFEFSGSIAPGRYEFKIVYTDPPGDDTYYDGGPGGWLWSGGTVLTRVFPGSPTEDAILFAKETETSVPDHAVPPAGWPTYNVTFSDAVDAPGISSNHPVKKIAAGEFAPIVFNVLQYPTDYDLVGTPPHQIGLPTKWGPEHLIPAFPLNHADNEPGAGYSTTVPGFWTGVTPAVSDLNVVTPDRMPWNLGRTKAQGTGASFSSYVANPMLLGNGNPDHLAASNSYDQGLPVEGQPEPATWKSKTWFTVGFTIVNAAGTALFQCATAGYSGLVAPAWNLTLGGVTAETHDAPPAGGQNTWATWRCLALFQPADTWIGGKTWRIGESCVDANGNQQTLISNWQPLQDLSAGQFVTDENNHTQQVVTAGTTGATAPSWGTALNATTPDGSVVWKLVILDSSSVSGLFEPAWAQQFGATTADASALWKLTAVATRPLKPAVPRARPIPRYPVYWADETIAALKPPTTDSESEKTIWGCGNQWFKSSYLDASGHTVYEAGWQEVFTYGVPAVTIGNQAYGWWIYSVSLNRIQPFPANLSGPGIIGAGDAGIGAGDGSIGAGGAGNAEPVQVTIGCLRDGAFVAFGSYFTGQTVPVLWPVFTSDALVYQASERVDVQAVAIAANFTGVSLGLNSMNHPICAAFYTDTATLLNLVN